jgi:hypothetical protein
MAHAPDPVYLGQTVGLPVMGHTVRLKFLHPPGQRAPARQRGNLGLEQAALKQSLAEPGL